MICSHSILCETVRKWKMTLTGFLRAALALLSFSAITGCANGNFEQGALTAPTGGELKYEVYGETGPFIIFTHATADYGDRRTQKPYIDALGESYRLVFIKYPPTEPQRFDLPAEGVAADYLALADAVGAETFFYYGYSWGCVSGLQLAIRTDRLTAFACGGFPVIDGPYAEMLKFARKAAAGPVTIDGVTVDQTGYARQLQSFYESVEGFDDRAAQDKLSMPRLSFVGAEDKVIINDTLVADFGETAIENQEELEALGWQTLIVPEKNHLEVLVPDVAVPLIKDFFDKHR